MSVATAVLVPVMGRPHRIAPLLANIREATPERHTVYFAASDAPTVLELRNAGAKHFTDAGDTFANRINRLYRETTELYMLVAADDYLFYHGWLTPLLDRMADVDGVVVADDLHNPNGTVCLVSRNYIDEMSGCVDETGVVLHSGYLHNFCDNELFETAESRGRFARCPESVIEHLHPVAAKAPSDATYELGMSGWAHDEALFFSRRPLWQ